jgi:hypothetical protein
MDNIMTEEKAREIVGDMYETFLYFQIGGKQKPKPLDYTLGEMVEANKIVAELNKTRIGNPSGKSVSIQMMLDDRLVAAIYCARHYEGGSLEKPKIITEVDGKVLMLIDRKFIDDESDEDDEY